MFISFVFVVMTTIASAQKQMPSFSVYSVKVERLTPRQPNLASHKNAGRFRTNLRRAAKGKVNFGGHFIVTTWGCGTNCTQSAIIDARNGQVFFPAEFEGVVQGFCELPPKANPADSPAMTDEYAPFIYKASSRLLILNGFRGGDFDNAKARCGTYYLEWTGKQFKQIKFTPGKRTDAP